MLDSSWDGHTPFVSKGEGKENDRHSRYWPIHINERFLARALSLIMTVNIVRLVKRLQRTSLRRMSRCLWVKALAEVFHQRQWRGGDPLHGQSS